MWSGLRTAAGEGREEVYINISVGNARENSYTMQVDVSNFNTSEAVSYVRADVMRRLGAERADWVQIISRGLEGDWKKDRTN